MKADDKVGKIQSVATYSAFMPRRRYFVRAM